MADVIEHKIIFQEGEDVRKLTGIIEAEDKFFIILKRRDGTRKIGKQYIIKIEPAGGKDD